MYGTSLSLPVNPVDINSYDNNNTLDDQNQIQISELSNPFYFPAENSYQVGTGEGIASRANTEPLSTCQFGEYPLIVFTSKGIWTLLQGQGDVLFSSVKPLNGEVPLSKEQITPIGTGVVYSTARGFYLVSGRSVQELSKVLYGLPNLNIQIVDNFKLRVNHTNLVQLPNSLSTVNAKTYMVNARLGFNKQNNELLVTNENYDYSYVYNFESGYWHKINTSFSILINAYPFVYALRSNGSEQGVFNVSEENFDEGVHTMISTRPCKIDGTVDFVLVHRAIQRCEIETKGSVFAGFYVFGSNDLKTWQMFQGSDKKTGRVTDIFLTRSHLKCKYFVFMFAAKLKEGSAINRLELQYY